MKKRTVKVNDKKYESRWNKRNAEEKRRKKRVVTKKRKLLNKRKIKLYKKTNVKSKKGWKIVRKKYTKRKGWNENRVKENVRIL